MARALRITWLGPNCLNLTRLKDVNDIGKNFAWSKMLWILPQRLLQKHAKKRLKFRKTPWIVTPTKCYTYSNAKSVVESNTLGKQKTNFARRAFRKGNQNAPEKCFQANYCLDGHSGINDWNFVIFEQCETHEQLKERETFWQHRLKTFYPIGLNEKEEYLY